MTKYFILKRRRTERPLRFCKDWCEWRNDRICRTPTSGIPFIDQSIKNFLFIQRIFFNSFWKLVLSHFDSTFITWGPSSSSSLSYQRSPRPQSLIMCTGISVRRVKDDHDDRKRAFQLIGNRSFAFQDNLSLHRLPRRKRWTSKIRFERWSRFINKGKDQDVGVPYISS